MSTISSKPQLQAQEFDEFADEGGFLAGRLEIPAWAISLMLHLVVVFGLYCVTYSTGLQTSTIITSAIDTIDPQTYKFEATAHDMLGSGADANILSPSQAATLTVSKDSQEEIEDKLVEQNLTVSIPEPEMPAQINKNQFAETFNASGTNERVGGVDGAIDRLTFEIAASLRENKTLVVWLFDASLSLNERRDAIADRFENVYKQLGMMKVGDERALKTAVVSYGQKTEIITPEPVDDVKDLVKAVRHIKPDESGVEYVFSAVNEAANRWASYRSSNKLRRNVMMIIVTDERGDDYARMEETIQKVSRLGMRVYCVGHAAILGREKGYIDFKDASGYVWNNLEMDQGPETVAPERLQLALWGQQGIDLDRISSGYGPYALTRLCAETGGLYLITDESSVTFDPAVMRNYPPDYRPIRDYEIQLKTNLAKAALVNASVSTKVDSIPRPQLAFRADSDTVLRQQITEAQKPAARLDYRLNEILQILESGEKDRPKLDTPRWRASYDLAMGRILAMRVRAFGYNSMLAEMKVQPKPFQKQGSNQWRLKPSSEITAGPAVKKLAEKAKEYLKRVVDEHPGTPWELIATKELAQPMGWDWEEATMVVATAGRNGKNAKEILLAEEEQKKQAAKKKAMEAKGKPKL